VLADSFGRIATDLRGSVTDRCDLRCSYCMPARGLDWLPSPALLTDDEVSRLIAVAVRRLGVTEVRFTGGEPLLRRGLPRLIAAAAALDPRPEISLTTNGIGLDRLAGPLAAAGLDRLNVSLDTLSRQAFKELARRDRLPDVLVGLAAAAEAGLAPVTVDGGPGRVGVIGSVTRPFCGTCDRVRLTADGQVRNCLFATTETDLRALLRTGADDDQLAAAWRGAVAPKLPGHGISDPGFLQPARPMSAIGG
jgi:molybdenum cofactor biosynthesis enzyme MoaA